MLRADRADANVESENVPKLYDYRKHLRNSFNSIKHTNHQNIYFPKLKQPSFSGSLNLWQTNNFESSIKK